MGFFFGTMNLDITDYQSMTYEQKTNVLGAQATNTIETSTEQIDKMSNTLLDTVTRLSEVITRVNSVLDFFIEDLGLGKIYDFAWDTSIGFFDKIGKWFNDLFRNPNGTIIKFSP